MSLTVKEKLKLIIDLGGSLESEALAEIERLEDLVVDEARTVCNWVRHEENHKTFWMSGCEARVKHQSGPYCQKCGKVINRTWIPKHE